MIDELDDENDLNVMKGGYIIDYHSCDFFPERFFQLVLVLRTDNSVLWERLATRFVDSRCPRTCCARVPLGWLLSSLTAHACYCREYHFDKIQENVQAEIMQVVLEEARTSYNPELIQVRNCCCSLLKGLL